MEFIQSLSGRIQLALGNEETGNEVEISQEQHSVSEKHSVVILGHTYTYTNEEVAEGAFEYIRSWFHWDGPLPDNINKDILSRLNFTYRTNFEPIRKQDSGPSPLNVRVVFRNNPLSTLDNVINHRDYFITDIGWGCMIRTGQSLLGNAIQMVKYGKDYRSADKDTHEITELFADNFNSPFSLHNFVTMGNKLNGISPGEWFGPATTSSCIQRLVKKHPECGIDECIISVSSGDISRPAVEEAFKRGENNILILLGLKLGINSVNEQYWDDIKTILGSEFSVGIAGGRPSSSLYFIGYYDDTLLYFDPHAAQPADMEDYDSSCHTVFTGKLNFTDIDPSMLIGFLITNEKEWKTFLEFVQSLKFVNILDNFYNCQEQTLSEQLIPSPVINATQSPEALSDDDYVDVGALIGSYTDDRDAGFQDIRCKNQNIFIVNSAVENGGSEIEVEKVLVEQDTKNITTHDL
ncbi:Cysteine protease ATG4 [Nakaseomyces bracarensis]|uniref:Cysteine protease n=1 Tax=Nakaseomyces bracarensis TaxID=273131 RepID=A0ABR4NYA7_9SACH